MKGRDRPTTPRDKGDLTGKRILLLSTDIFGYSKVIIAEFERRGAMIDFMLDRPFRANFMKALTKHKRNWVLGPATRLYEKNLDSFGRSHYDYVIVINGMTLSTSFLARLRRSYPAARFVLYMWDSVQNRTYVPDFLPYFDRCLSFDPDARDQLGMELRPLFFSPGFADKAGLPPSLDISFVGTAHSDRYAIISRLDKKLPPDIRRYWFLYLQAPWVFWAYKASNPGFRSASRDLFHYQPLPGSEVQKIFAASSVIVDVEHPLQKGLTMRTLETLGARKKLVTTNSHVQDYDFYDPQNIQIIDRTDPSIDTDFFKSPYTEPSRGIVSQYSISGWVESLVA